MNNVLETGKAIVTNKYFWWVVVAIIIIFVIYKYKARISQFLRRDNGDYTLGIGDTETYNADASAREARKREIEALALRVKTAIGDAGFDRIPAFKEVIKLNDAELKYLSNYYSIISPEETLYAAINDEWLFFDNEDDIILAKLSKLNENA